MTHPRVYIKATFVATKADKVPSVFVERPDDISNLVGEICCKGFALLQYRIVEIVKNTDNNFWFQKDENNTYHFDESTLLNG